MSTVWTCDSCGIILPSPQTYGFLAAPVAASSLKPLTVEVKASLERKPPGDPHICPPCLWRNVGNMVTRELDRLRQEARDAG